MSSSALRSPVVRQCYYNHNQPPAGLTLIQDGDGVSVVDQSRQLPQVVLGDQLQVVDLDEADVELPAVVVHLGQPAHHRGGLLVACVCGTLRVYLSSSSHILRPDSRF